MLRDRQPRQKLRVLPQARTNLDLALTFFITAEEGERCTPRMIRTYIWSLESVIAWLRDHDVDQVEDLTANHVRMFLADQTKQNYGASHIQIYARTIKTWLRSMYRKEALAAMFEWIDVDHRSEITHLVPREWAKSLFDHLPDKSPADMAGPHET